jgi:hypothetical protein
VASALLGSRIVRAVSPGAALIVCAAAAAAAATPTGHRLPGTAAGRALAQHALIRRSSLGSGFSATPAPHSLPDLTCPAFHPPLRGVVKIGTAVSPTFSGGQSGPFVSQAAYAFANHAQETTVWRKVIRRGLLRCVRDALEAGSSSRVQIKATAGSLLGSPRVSAQSAAYRARGTASMPDESVDVYLDMLVVGRGSVITTVAITSFSDPVARAFERMVAQAALKRLPAR